jgi:hypothetical protein
MGERKKKLDPKQAWDAWIAFEKPSFKGTLKFTEDHTLPGSQMLSKKNAIDAAARRFEKDGTTTSTWSDMKPGDVAKAANKAGIGAWKADVFRGKQQLVVLVQYPTITVELTPLNSKQYTLLQSQKKKSCRLVHARTRKEQQVYCSTKEHPTQWCVMGDWDPFKGAADLHHYARASAMPTAHSFIDKYLVWWCEFDDAKNQFAKPLRPLRPE